MTTPPSSALGAGPRQRYRPRQVSGWSRVPVSVWVAAPVLVLGGSWVGYRAWRSAQTVVSFAAVRVGPERFDGGRVAPGAAAMPSLELTLFPEQMNYSAPSPPPPIVELRSDGTDEVWLESAMVPEAAVLRYRGPGIGAGYTRVVRGRNNGPVPLHPPASLRGRVGTPSGFLCFGVRALGLQPVAGARVIGMGGGALGVPLCETTTDADGRFVLEGFSSGLPSLGVRVLAEGYAIAFAEQYLAGAADPIVPLVATGTIAGSVVLPDGVPLPDGLRVLAKGVPGVDARPGPDGAFRLDNVPPNLEPRLLVHGLPDGYTHRRVNSSPGAPPVRIEVTRAAHARGRVVDLQTQRPIGKALVWHENGPGGWVQDETDDGGHFVLGLLPPGDVVLRAQITATDPLGHKDTLSGELRIRVAEGKDLDDVVVRIH